jgi:hypothetical protein
MVTVFLNIRYEYISTVWSLRTVIGKESGNTDRGSFPSLDTCDVCTDQSHAAGKFVSFSVYTTIKDKEKDMKQYRLFSATYSQPRITEIRTCLSIEKLTVGWMDHGLQFQSR